MAKRFVLSGGFIRDKEYLLSGKEKGTIVYCYAQDPKKKAPKVNIKINEGTGARKKEVAFDFNTIGVKSRDALGNIVSRFPAKSASAVG
jgi:topoisomerase-4 subunit A